MKKNLKTKIEKTTLEKIPDGSLFIEDNSSRGSYLHCDCIWQKFDCPDSEYCVARRYELCNFCKTYAKKTFSQLESSFRIRKDYVIIKLI